MLDAPRFALVEVEGGLVVEEFDATRHLSSYGYTLPSVTLFVDREEVAHLRDLILN